MKEKAQEVRCLVSPCLLGASEEIRHWKPSFWIRCVFLSLFACFLFWGLNFYLNGEGEHALPLHYCRFFPKNIRLPRDLHPNLGIVCSSESTTCFFFFFLTLLTLSLLEDSCISLLQYSGEIDPKKDFCSLPQTTIGYVQCSLAPHSPRHF